jgi:hypothetical protein
VYDSQYGTPIILQPGGSSTPLTRLSLSKAGKDTYDEAWLQDMLFANATALPIDQLDRSYENLVPVCRELGTPAGYLDILYATPKGHLVLLEAKLWRNPEARRKVIGQILDYATEMSGWSYEDLQREVSKATKRKGNALFEIVREKYPNTDEAAFVDEVTRSLRAGRFMLLIVGDGIREGAGAIAGFLERSGALQFSFGLVEMGLYDLPDGGRLVQPRVLARTTEIQRSVIVLSDDRMAVADPEVELDERDENPDQEELSARVVALWSDFIEQLRLDDQSQPLPSATKVANIYFRMPARGQVKMSAWLGVYGKSNSGVRIRFSKTPEAVALYRSLLADREAIEKEVGFPLTWETRPNGHCDIGTRRQFSDIFDPANRDELFGYLSDATNRMVNAFRPRLARLATGVVGG